MRPYDRGKARAAIRLAGLVPLMQACAHHPQGISGYWIKAYRNLTSVCYSSCGTNGAMLTFVPGNDRGPASRFGAMETRAEIDRYKR